MCLPGLARTVADFEVVASALATDSTKPRYVVALDSRGGRSDYDRKANYTLAAELTDLMAVLTALAITRAVFLGTSRGGILTMLLAAARPAGGHIVPDYDVKLRTILKGINFDQPLPPLWHAFDALARVPVMVIRGSLSDILSAATVDAMRRRRKRLEAVEVPDQGHAPLLMEPDIIASFAARCETDMGRSRTN